jgi:TRAP-type uncharacterized transport system fused permease subunit|tara:strand:- start:264 stop:530 length:267 start_codon:yes stop_codon:yes gene_type:complete
VIRLDLNQIGKNVFKGGVTMDIVEKVKRLDKMTSKYFVPFSIIVYALIFGWNYSAGTNIFSSFLQDMIIFFILVNQGVIISYITWYKD